MTKLADQLNQANVSKSFAANITANTSSAINAIIGDPNLTPEAKRGAIDNIIANANSTMQWGSTFYNTTLPGVAAPGGTAGTITPGASASGLKAAISARSTDADAGTAAGLAYAQRMGLTPDQTVSLWNQAMGTNFTRADYDRIAGGRTTDGGGAGGGGAGGGGGADGGAGAQVVVYGPDGKMYSSPAAARAAGVTNYTNTPPNTGGGAGGGGGGGGGIVGGAMQRDAWGREPGDPMYGTPPYSPSDTGGQ
jgi:hypothetical protein